MKSGKDQNPSTAAAKLRSEAEKQLHGKKAEVLPPRTEEETQRLVHELEVHQLELEMQNADLRAARDEVEKSLATYTDLYDFAPVSYFTLDRDGVIRAVNLTGARLLGVERSRLLGRRFGLFLPGNAQPPFSEFLRKVFASGDKESCEVTLTGDGSPPLFVQVEAVADPFRAESRLAVIDISERRRLEGKLEILRADLAARAAELEAANIELEAFNYSVSHDLSQPLTIISGYCQVLKELCSDKLDESCRGHLRGIDETALRMGRLIDTLLRFSSVARKELRREKVDLSAMAKDVAGGLQLASIEKRVAIRIAEGIMAEGDPDLLRVVLENLIGNAWKYAGAGDGTVIEFGHAEVDGNPAWFVRDNGPGFDMADVEQLFCPFQRLPGTEAQGHGIGLATVDRIVRRHGGRVWAESAPGQGATFFFTLKSIDRRLS